MYTIELVYIRVDFCILLQQTSKTESESYDNSYEQRLPILADLVLYYCRYAARPALIQLYQIEVRHTSALDKHTHTHSCFLTHMCTFVNRNGNIIWV